MTLLWHLVRTDLRRFAWPIGAWTLLTIAATALDGLAPQAAFREGSAQVVALGAGVLWLARLLLAAVLVASIVQGHRLVGTTAFWMTRPIPPGPLMASKLVILGGALIAVPAACDAVLMAAYRVPAGDSGRVLVEWTLTRTGIVLVLAVAAAMTGTVTRFALACAAAVATIALAVNVAIVIALATSEQRAFLVGTVSTVAMTSFSDRPDQTPAIAGLLVMIAGALWVLRSMYRTRSRWRAGALIASALAATIGVGAAWPWPILRAEPEPPSGSESISLTGPAQDVSFDKAGVQFDERRWRTLHARASLSGVPDGWYVTARLLRGALTDEGATLTSLPALGAAAPPVSPDGPAPQAAVMRHALGVTTLHGRYNVPADSVPILMVSDHEVPAARTRARYTGEFLLDLSRFELAAAIPLTRGSTFQEGPYRLVIEDVQLRDDGPVVLTRISRATSAFHRQAQPHYSFYLRNMQTSEAIGGNQLRAGAPLAFPGAFIYGYGVEYQHGFSVQAARLIFPSTRTAPPPFALAQSNDYQFMDEAWMQSAELAIVRMTTGGRIIRTLDLPELTISDGR